MVMILVVQCERRPEFNRHSITEHFEFGFDSCDMGCVCKKVARHALLRISGKHQIPSYIRVSLEHEGALLDRPSNGHSLCPLR